MEFSKYVREAIATVDYLEKDRDFHAISLIKGAAERAENESDSNIISIIAGAMTMRYSIKEQAFCPLYVEYGGGRTFGLEDLNDENLEILRLVTDMTGSDYLRTRFSHIVWAKTKEKSFGQLAVTGYLAEFQKIFDPVHWVSCYEKIQSAYHITSVMGKNTDYCKQIRTVILQKLLEMNGEDSAFLSMRLLKLVLKDLEKEQLPQYVKIAEKLFRKNICSQNSNTHLADEAFAVVESFYKRMKRNDDINVSKGQYASYYEMQARNLEKSNDYFRAVIMMKKACLIYMEVDRNKAITLRIEMEPWQKLALNDLHIYKTTIDVKDISEAVENMFADLTLPEAIVQFGRIARIYKVDDIKQQLMEKQDEQLFSSMFSSSLLNDQGQAVQELPPISDVEVGSDSFRKHMVRYVAERRRLIDSIPVAMAFQQIRKYGTIPEEALDFLVKDNAIIPENRAEIIREGLSLALNGKLYTAMHILQPQTEHIFRHLVKMCGDTVTFLKDDGSEACKPLSSLFKSEKLLESYDEDILFTFQSIMDEPVGENLRNLNGHGLLEPSEGNGAGVVYFLSLLIMLLSVYGNHSRKIRAELVKRSENEER